MPRTIKNAGRHPRRSKSEERPRTATQAVGGHADLYAELTVFDLKMRVKDLGLHGYSDKSRAQLVEMLRNR